MSNLSSQDLKDLLKVNRTSLECRQVNELQKSVLPLVQDLFKAESSIFVLTRGPRKVFDFGRAVAPNIRKEYFSKYADYYSRIDPLFQYYKSPYTILTFEQFVSSSVFVQSEYYNEFLRPQGMHYGLVICLKYAKELLATIGLTRSEAASPFTYEDKAKAELLIPCLAGALKKSLMEEKISKHKDMVTSMALDLPFKGVMVLDEYYDPIYINHEAANMTALLSTSEISQEESCFILPEEIIKLCEEAFIISEEKADAITKTSSLKIEDRDRHVSVHVALLRDQKEMPRYLICLEPHEPLGSFFTCLRRFGLSRREIEVAYLVYEGYANSQIADRLYISENTVEKHLYSIFNKCGVNSRTSFARLITGLEHKTALTIN